MKTLLTIVALVAVAFLSPCALAKKPKPTAAPTPELKILEVDAVSVTVGVGKAGDEHFTYKITDGTKVTLNGAPVFARDLKPGMIAKFTLTPDHVTAISIEAKDPPAHPEKGHVG